MNTFWTALLFFLPGGLANMAPVFSNKIPGLNKWKTPLDFGKSFRDKRIFGDNKTWRGLMSGILLGGIVATFESAWAQHALGHDQAWFIVAGLLMGFGALAGDAVESFFKRQIGIKPGHSWFPFDQTDFIIGGLLAVTFLVHLNAGLIIRIFVVYFGLHLTSSYIGYKLKLKDKPI
jgi:CDP-2,3-bis-(O-geranylgeranyl)-sn-glycerol synthase